MTELVSAGGRKKVRESDGERDQRRFITKKVKRGRQEGRNKERKVYRQGVRVLIGRRLVGRENGKGRMHAGSSDHTRASLALHSAGCSPHVTSARFPVLRFRWGVDKR